MPDAVGFGWGLCWGLCWGFGLGVFVSVGVALALALGADDVVYATVAGLLDGAAPGFAGRSGPPDKTLPTRSAPPTTKISTTSATARRRIWASVAGVASGRRFADGTRTSVPAVRPVENEELRRDLARPGSRSRSMLVPDMRRCRRT
jgi:hypothetical protein